MGVYANRKAELAKLATKAIKLNNEIALKAKQLTDNGYDIDNRKIQLTAERIQQILAKSKPTKNDLEIMKDFASVRNYDFVKVDGQNFKDIQKHERQSARQLNKALETASSIYPGNNQYTQYLEPLMEKINETGHPEKYYIVDEDYDPDKPAELFQHIKFKEIPLSAESEALKEAILELKWSDKAKYLEEIEQITHGAYDKNVSKLKNEYSMNTIVALENIMNSSAAWHIASRDTDDSEQVKSRWEELFRKATDAYDNDFQLFYDVLNMIEHERSFEEIIDYVDREIMNMI